jgi:hypothetical protein
VTVARADRKRDRCETVRVASRQVRDGWYGIPWCLEKWQIGALLKGYSLPFCEDADAESDGDLYVVIPQSILTSEPEDLRRYSLEEVLASCVAGEYGTAVGPNDRQLKFLIVGYYQVMYEDMPSSNAATHETDIASLCDRLVIWIGSLTAELP